MSWWRQEKVLSITKHKRNANQNRNETSPIKKTKNNKCRENMEKAEPLHTAGRKVNYPSLYGEWYGRSSKN